MERFTASKKMEGIFIVTLQAIPSFSQDSLFGLFLLQLSAIIFHSLSIARGKVY